MQRLCSIRESRDPDEETAPPEPETGEGKFVFPNGAVYGGSTSLHRQTIPAGDKSMDVCKVMYTDRLV